MRERSLMLTLLISLVIPLLEYCCELWNKWKAKDIQDIEAIQRSFTYKITEVQHLKNRERLHELNLYSFDRRRDRYIIIYIWKITQPMAPNIDKVDRGILLNKLKKIEINGKIDVWIHNFLSNRQQCVAVNGTTSSEAQVRRFVPLESVLGPLLLPMILEINGKW